MLKERLLINLPQLAISRFKIREEILKDCLAVAINRFDNSADLLWETRRRSNCFEIKKTSKYLNWRYIQFPLATYQTITCYRKDKLIGYFVVGIEIKKLPWNMGHAKVGFINDWLLDNEITDKETFSMLEHIINCLVMRKVDYIVTIAYPNAPIKPYIKRRGFS